MRPRPQKSSSEFEAPLSRGARVIGTVVTIGLLTMAVVLPFLVSPGERIVSFLGSTVCVLIPAITALFMVRGYELRRNELWVKRLFWQTRISLKGLRNATIDPKAMKSAFRVAGNGGFFGWVGWFRNKRLGAFRAFVSDPARSVILEFHDRKLVVSPKDPTEFIARLGLTEASTRGKR